MGEPRIEQISQDDWTDQDLLTKEEAGKRLAAEITEIAGRLESLAGGQETEALTRRLDVLRAAYDALQD